MYTCSCPQFQHYYFCKHAIGLALYRKEVTVPVQFSRARRSAQGSGGAKGDQAGQLPQNWRLLAAEQPPSEMR